MHRLTSMFTPWRNAEEYHLLLPLLRFLFKLNSHHKKYVDLIKDSILYHTSSIIVQTRNGFE